MCMRDCLCAPLLTELEDLEKKLAAWGNGCGYCAGASKEVRRMRRLVKDAIGIE